MALKESEFRILQKGQNMCYFSFKESTVFKDPEITTTTKKSHSSILTLEDILDIKVKGKKSKLGIFNHFSILLFGK